MDFQVGFNVAVMLAGALMGWILKTITDRMDGLQSADTALTDKVQKIEVLVAGQYVKRDDLDKLTAALFAKLDKIDAKLDAKADK